MSRIIGFLVRGLVPLVILTTGIAIAVILLNSGSTAGKKQRERNAVLVAVQPVTLTHHPTQLDAMGLVMPARVIELKPRVSGEIVAISPELVPGGRIRAGQTVVRIDATDYELALRQRETELARARTAWQLEQGQQAIAREELTLLGEALDEADRDLVLRQPQLEAVEAALKAAELAVERARLDLERTEVIAPFNAVVRSFEVNLGTQVSVTSTIANLVGTDAYWVEALLPVDQLSWIRIPNDAGEEGAAARVFLSSATDSEEFREGEVIRLATDLERDGRMARVLISVPDPLALGPESPGQAALILGAYTRVQIEGFEVPHAALLDRTTLHDGDKVWIMTPENRLEIREVSVAFRDREKVLVSEGLAQGELLVTTDLAAAVDGLPLRVESPESASPSASGNADTGIPAEGGHP